MPRSKETRLILALLDNFFKNPGKTDLWLRTKNPLLGDLKPLDMIKAGKEKRLLNFIKNSLRENK